MDELREFLGELRENWDDSYWWADHPALRVTLLSIIAGAIGLMFTWLETRIQLAARITTEAT
jgi:hypothetical protein